MMFKHIAFAGLGLIGGSLALSFAEQGIKLSAFDKDTETIAKAASTGLFEYTTEDLDTLLSLDFDVLYICLPVKTACDLVLELGKRGFKRPVTDAGSTKADMAKVAEEAGIIFCGGHPIAGKEVSGFANAKSGIFSGAYHILTPTCPDFDIEPFIEIHKAIGMDVHIMTPERHDIVFGLVSHLPHITAFSMVQTVSAVDLDALNYTGAGFKDFSRIAASDPRMWTDIFLENKDNMVSLIDSYVAEMQKWKEAIENADEKEIYSMIEHAARVRRTLS
ncbi:MAG: prephenate dehydrogenase/arogenate dehydrogenase family protein [Denitrovibrio sp.]|nr:MAG: prephenate dehydrogenase/arogenate dehydrogenase family protein [Denitrovibrio sp.]